MYYLDMSEFGARDEFPEIIYHQEQFSLVDSFDALRKQLDGDVGRLKEVSIKNRLRGLSRKLGMPDDENYWMNVILKPFNRPE